MKIFRNILAVILGWFIGSIVNMGIITFGHDLISTPEGFDNSNMDTLAASIHLLEPINFLPVFLAHGLGTLFGAFAAAKIAATKKMVFAFVIGGLFFIGGIMMIFMVPAPLWYNAVDLIGAYIPMAWLGWKIAGGK